MKEITIKANLLKALHVPERPFCVNFCVIMYLAVKLKN